MSSACMVTGFRDFIGDGDDDREGNCSPTAAVLGRSVGVVGDDRWERCPRSIGRPGDDTASDGNIRRVSSNSCSMMMAISLRFCSAALS